MTAQTAASLVEVHARLLALVGKRDLEVVTFLRLATVEIPALVLVFADVVNVDDIHKTISVEVLVSIFVESFLSATVDIVRQHQHLLSVSFFGFICLISPVFLGSVSLFFQAVMCGSVYFCARRIDSRRRRSKHS